MVGCVRAIPGRHVGSGPIGHAIQRASALH